jgi:hypothetical protein
MTTTKQRLDEKVEKMCNESVKQRFTDSYNNGDRIIARIASKHFANEILSPLILEIVECLQEIESGKVYTDGKKGKTPKTRARIMLNKFEEFLR